MNHYARRSATILVLCCLSYLSMGLVGNLAAHDVCADLSAIAKQADESLAIASSWADQAAADREAAREAIQAGIQNVSPGFANFVENLLNSSEKAYDSARASLANAQAEISLLESCQSK